MIITRKRLFTEIPDLEKIYNKVQITFDNKTKINVYLYDPIKSTTQSIEETYIPASIEFIVSSDYPFKPPMIQMNSNQYLSTIPHHDLSKYKLKFPFKGKCLHCNFITKENWSPINTMT